MVTNDFRFDVDLQKRDILDLASADALAAFFASLRYDTSARTAQTASSLGVSETVARPIRRIEMLADRDLLQVYLVELSGVTIKSTRDLVRSFRDRAGNFLFVLTSDYQRIDFVLLDRLPAELPTGGISVTTAPVRPRVLTVERRNPSTVSLRVLRRFTWTENDGIAQFEKIRSAYSIAEWSEEDGLFNNRALFSDHYLKNRLRDDASWSDDPASAFRSLRDLFLDRDRAGTDEARLRGKLLEPAFKTLEFHAKAVRHDPTDSSLPDYELYADADEEQPMALCLTYPWARYLDGKDETRDLEAPNENPGAVVVSLLQNNDVPWVIVTNGKLWRLYAKRAHSRATSFYEIDLEEVLAEAAARDADPFRYFWLLFRRQAFESVTFIREGREERVPFLDRLLLESEDYAKALGERLKGRVFDHVFPHLASGFISRWNGEVIEADLVRTYRATLTLLYRLLFLLYAEARDLLPVREVRGYYEKSLSNLKKDVAASAGGIEDEIEAKLKTAFAADSTALYERLSELVSVIDNGDSDLNVPFYNGGLFSTAPSDDDTSDEAEASRFLRDHAVPDRQLAAAIDLLAREDDPRYGRIFVDYKSLGVRHLGSIYEGLLEFRLQFATERLAIVREKSRDVFKPWREIDEGKRTRLDRDGRFVKKGELYLENDKHERKATGSYYTPDYIVKYIVEHTVGPVVGEKLEALRPKLREAQAWHSDHLNLAKAKGERLSKYEYGDAVESRWRTLIDDVFDIKVLDPAMGSGHFLVEAVDFITDKILDFLNAFPWNPVTAHLRWTRETILKEMERQSISIDPGKLTDVNLLKRHVLKRCVYGVDLNPMAVELAKVSLWLDCFTLGAPLSFLDHHFRCGNSLLGVSIEKVEEKLRGGTQAHLFSGNKFEGLKQSVAGMIHIGEHIPYVIDNESAILRDILREVLANHAGRSLDVATAYFTVGGFSLLRDELKGLGSFRLLLGAEPSTGEQVGLRPDVRLTRGLITADLERLPFDEPTLRKVEDLIAWLRSDRVRVHLHEQGFLHAKAWLFYSDRPGQQMLFDRFRPVLAIVGSSNFTAPGLTSNRELNLAHKVLLDESEAEDRAAGKAVEWLSDARASEAISPMNRQLLKSEVGARAIIDLEKWYQREWEDAREFKDELIELLDASKFGQKEYTPWQVYMKALFEYFRDDLGDEAETATRSAIDLAEFQEDAIKKARRILARYDGVMIADSVGLGKTWIGKKLLEDYAYHMRQKAIVICPAALREIWGTELVDASIAAVVLSQEELGREEFDWRPWGDVDFIVVDESHNFRNPNAQRSDALASILSANGGKGASGARKKVVLVTATPVSNSVLDLYNQLTLITQNDRTFFAAAGIGDLYKLFLAARRDPQALPLYNLLEEVVIRRTRPFIRRAYPDATIRGERINFPDRKLKTIHYNLEETYAGLYEEIVSGVEALRLAPYHLEAYKKTKADEFEEGRERALVGIFKSRYLKRLESSVEAFRISVRRALQFLETFESYILEGRLLKSSDFHKAIRYLSREDEEDDATVSSLADAMESKEEIQTLLATMPSVDPRQYDLRRLHDDVRRDVQILTSIHDRIRDIRPRDDLKLQRLKDLLRNELRGKKVLIFTYYVDTARYLFRELATGNSPAAKAFRKQLGNVVIRRLDSGADAKERRRAVQHFAPRANRRPDLIDSDEEIDILISTDVLAEGQNLQDCGHLLNYDLHWNPTRMVQRAGRIDRIGSPFPVLWINNMFPDEGLERLLGLVESLSRRIEEIDRLGFLDASVLGETVHPRNFNTLRRIREEDGSVIEEEEQQSELISHEYLQQQLRQLLMAGGEEMLTALPDGIHSGLRRERARGVFFYFQSGEGENKQHFWRYVDLHENNVIDNRYIIANLIACSPDTPRVVEPDAWSHVFELQEQAIASILKASEQQAAVQAAPKALDPVQQTIATAIQQNLNRADVDRTDAVDSIRFLSRPIMRVHIRRLRELAREYQAHRDTGALLGVIREIRTELGDGQSVAPPPPSLLRREDLRLICFDFVSA